MINSLCGGVMKMVKSGEQSSYHRLPISPTASVSESNSINVLPSTSVLERNNPVLSSLNDPQGFKYEEDNMDDDVEIQSPDNSAIWNSYFADNDDEASFMISSPRSSNALDLMPSSPKITQHLGFNQNYDHCVAEHTLLHGESISKYSPPSSNSSHVVGGTCSISNGESKGKLQRVFSSPRKKYMKLVSLDRFLTMKENTNGSSSSKDGEFGEYSTLNMPSLGFNAGGSESGMTLSAMLKCLPSSNNSNICESTVNKVQRDLPMTQEKNVSLFSPYRNPFSPAQISQQQKQQYTFDHGSFIPLYAQEHATGLQLLHLLLACAEAVAKTEYIAAEVYLVQLNRIVTPLGDSMQRVACCFTEALSERLSAITTANPNSTDSKIGTLFPDLNSLDTIRTYQVVYQACPYLKFAHFTANQAIFEAFGGEERVHVIDLDILQGYQWPSFMQALAARQGGAPFVRLTGIGSSPTSLGETGRYLTGIAQSLKIPFEFEAVSEPLEELNPHIFQRRLGEAVAVSSINVLHRVSGNSLANLLGVIHDQTPEILILVEQEASHNGPYFLGRFLEALHYYSAIFDSMEATFLSNSDDRAKVEKYIYAPEIRNIVASEGSDRVERHEKLEKWRKVMEGKGFQAIPLSETQ